MVPAAGPCRGRSGGLAPCCTRPGPRDEVVPGGSLWRRFRAACAAVSCCVLTRSLTRPPFCTVHLSKGDSAAAPGLILVDANTAPSGSEDTTPGSCACARVLALLHWVGRAGLLDSFWCASALLWPFSVLSLFAWPPPSFRRPFFFFFLALWLCLWPWVPWARLLLVCPPPPAPPLFFPRPSQSRAAFGLGAFFFFFQAWRSPAQDYTNLLNCEVPRRTAAIYSKTGKYSGIRCR